MKNEELKERAFKRLDEMVENYDEASDEMFNWMFICDDLQQKIAEGMKLLKVGSIETDRHIYKLKKGKFFIKANKKAVH